MPMPNYQNGMMQQNQFYGIPSTQPNQYAYTQPIISRPMMIPGRMINSSEEIMPNEVPMDGSVGLFYKNDLSCIYSKSWNSDGTIRTIKFVPYEEEAKANTNEEETLSIVLSKLDAIEKSIPNYSKTAFTKQRTVDKKEANR